MWFFFGFLFCGLSTLRANEFLIGKAIKTLLVAEYLRRAILISECKKEMGPNELRYLSNKSMQPLVNNLYQRLSLEDKASFERLINSREHRDQLKNIEITYIAESVEAKKSGTPVSFACGQAFQHVANAILRATIAYDDAIKN
jgi:hypothetical protein